MNPEIKKRLEMIRRGEVPPGYKKTKVGIIPEEWEIKKLGEAVVFLDEKRKPIKDSERAKMKGQYPYYGASGIIDYVNDYLFDENLILLGEDGENIISRNCRLAFQIYGKTWVNNHAHVLKPNPESNITFVSELLENLNYEKYNTGTAQPKLNQKVCSEILIALPQFVEQTNIAKVISCCDQTIEKQEKLIELKKEQKKGLAYKLLTGKLRIKGFIGKWQNKSLSEYFEKINEKNDENNNTILTMSAQSGLIRQEHFFSKQVASENLSRYFLLKNGDYAYNKSYSIGYPFGAIKRLEKFEKGILSPLYICFRIKKCSISSDYCKHYFDSGLLNKEIQKIAQEGARNHGLLNVSSEEFFQMCMHVPADIKEQNAIAEILTTADREIDLLEKELAMMKEQKKGLMELLLTGIVRVK